MNIAVYSQVLNEENLVYIQQLFDVLNQRGHKVFIWNEYREMVQDTINLSSNVHDFSNHEDLAKSADYLISLGGDGTLLSTITLIRDSGIPVVGVNIGRLGFLATIGKEEIEGLIIALENDTYIVDSRSLIHLENNAELFGDVNYALNEFTLQKKDSSSMMTVHAYLNGEYLNTYWADGVIVSTPTGSTGYSLSCGGPVIFPSSESLVITPIAPHNLNIRPLVVPDDVVLSFQIEGRGESFMASLDSRYETVSAKAEIAVRKEAFSIKLIRLKEQNFLTTLRKKIMWGADNRN